MNETIKRIAINAVLATNPVNVLFGTVLKNGPIEVEIHQKLKLGKEFIIMTQSIQELGLTIGDKVVMLRMQGGHQFLILDKVVDE